MHEENHELGFERWFREHEKRALDLTMDWEGWRCSWAWHSAFSPFLSSILSLLLLHFLTLVHLVLALFFMVERERERGKWNGRVVERGCRAKLNLLYIPLHSCWHMDPSLSEVRTVHSPLTLLKRGIDGRLPIQPDTPSSLWFYLSILRKGLLCLRYWSTLVERLGMLTSTLVEVTLRCWIQVY